MKKLILPMLVLFLLTFSANVVTAQIAVAKDQLFAKGPHIVLLEEPIAAPVLAENYVSIKAMRDFTKSFNHASAIKWYKTPQGQMAYFTERGIASRAVYNNKGNWLYTMRSYNEQDLSKEIRAQVKSMYYDYSITRVNEITADGKVVYFVRMEDSTHCVTARVCEGEDIDVIESFLK